MQVDNINGVNISATGAVCTRHIASSAVNSTKSAFMLSIVFILTIRAFSRANCGTIF